MKEGALSGSFGHGIIKRGRLTDGQHQLVDLSLQSVWFIFFPALVPIFQEISISWKEVTLS